MPLVAEWLPEDDFHGRLRVQMSTSGFAGVGEAWFNPDEIDLFVERLLAYPLDDSNLPVLRGVTDDRFSLRVSRQNTRGDLRVWARLTDDALVFEGGISTNYNDLERFANALRAQLRGGAEEAALP